MKRQLKLMLLLLGVLFMIHTGCRKEHAVPTTITMTSLASTPEPYTETGTFVSTGGLTTSGTFVMIIEFIGTDAIHCIATMTTAKGTFIQTLDCSLVTNEGEWNIISGTGAYSFLKGTGSLLMTFPPGVVGMETQTGVVWLHK